MEWKAHILPAINLVLPMATLSVCMGTCMHACVQAYTHTHTHTHTHTCYHECLECNTDIQMEFHPLENSSLSGVVNEITKSDIYLRHTMSEQRNAESRGSNDSGPSWNNPSLRIRRSDFHDPSLPMWVSASQLTYLVLSCKMKRLGESF